MIYNIKLLLKKEIIELKNDLKNVTNDNFDLKQEMLLLKIDKQLDNEQTNSKPNEQEVKTAPVNKLLFLIMLLHMVIGSVLSTD